MKIENICMPEKVCQSVLVAVTVMLSCQICCGMQRPLSGPILAHVKAIAQAGKPAAQNELAWQYVLQGDNAQAELLYGKAAQEGYVPAQGKLGEMLFVHARLTLGLKYSVREAIVSRAIGWLSLAANQGDKLAQADLAGLYLNGEFVKPDLIESYKWADLAARETPLAPGSINGRSIRDVAARKMSVAQIAEARSRVTAFIPHVPAGSELLKPAWLSEIKLSGLGGPKSRPLAIINNEIFAVGDSNVLNVAGKAVTVQCLQIQDKTVVVQIEGLDMPRELMLGP